MENIIIENQIEETPVIEMKDHNKTIEIGLHFSESKKETLEKKIKRLIHQEVQKGNV